jgi:hypothetical protein
LDQIVKPQTRIRRSELADGISAKNLILNISVELTAEEILGMLKKLAGFLADSIKPKISKKDVQLGYDLPLRNKLVAEGFWIMEIPKVEMKEALIELPITIHRNSLKAVIDTRSQLNIISEKVYKQFANLPINQSKTLILKDVNGGKGT